MIEPPKLQMPRLHKPIVLLSVVFILFLSLHYLQTHGYVHFLPLIADGFRALTIISGAFLIASVFLHITASPASKAVFAHTEIEHRLILSKVYIGIVYILTALAVLWSFGLTIDNITVFIGLATTGIAFAIREIILSYFVWFMLLTKRPFRIGDYIRVGDNEGRVQHVGTFYVILDETPQTREDHVRIPNKVFLEKNIYNYGREHIQCTIRIAIENFEQIDERMEQLRREVVTYAQDATVELDVLGDKIYIRVDCHTTLEHRARARDEILRAVVRLFKQTAPQIKTQ